MFATVRMSFIVVTTLSVAASSAAQPSLTREQMEADLKQLAGTVKSAWAYHEDKRQNFGVDINKRLERSLGRLDHVRSNAQFGLVLREFMAGLKEGHAEVYIGHLSPPPNRHWPLLLRPVKEGLAVVTVELKLQKETQIARGDLLRSVDGKAVEKLIEDAERYVSASTDTARRRLAVDRMGGTDAGSVELELERPDGRRYRCTVPTLDAPVRAAAGDGKKFVEWQKLEGGVGYLCIPTFAFQPPEPPKSGSMEDLDRAMAPAKRELDQAFAALAKTDSSVLDLRGNQGGSVFLASYVAEHLLSPGFVYHSGQRRKSPEALKLPDIAALPADYWKQAHVWRPSQMAGVRHHEGPSHRGRLVVLIDELCFSTVDDLLACLADLHPNIRFVGRPTNGGTGEPRIIATLEHSKVAVQFCIMQMRSPKGRLIEGRGIRPDVAVQWSRDDVIHDRDPDLAAASKETR